MYNDRIIEFMKGELPWGGFNQRSTVLSLKRATNNESLVKGLPEEMLECLHYLQGLNYGDTPNYSYITELFHQICIKRNIALDSPFDWQLDDRRNRKVSSEDKKHEEIAPKKLNTKSRCHSVKCSIQ